MTLEELRDHLIAEGCNRNELAIALIEACISSSIDLGPDIFRTVTSLGLHPRSVGIQLDQNRGPNPARHRWFRTGDGRYFLHN